MTSAVPSAQDPLHPLLVWLRSVLPPEAGLSGGPIGDPPPGPYPEEEALVARAVEVRVREFRAGRAHAREALLQIGRPPAAILRGAGGEPLWPADCVGAIAHDQACAVAAAGARRDFAALGIDVESATPLDADLVRLVAGPDELAAAAQALLDSLDAAKCLFVAKECVIKALGGPGRAPPDFRQIRLAVSPSEDEALTFRLSAPIPGLDPRAIGHLGWRGERLAAIMCVPAAGSRIGG
ncbi:4'-phosphopantetheinyl transferase family protein [Phenylobacterium sp.]|uniref:4'-phosphopantetheinyl transferase family protein n=1 Tax=Phenylobacterium sp. TaxID=1871053 RepID=UPI002F405DA0